MLCNIRSLSPNKQTWHGPHIPPQNKPKGSFLSFFFNQMKDSLNSIMFIVFRSFTHMISYNPVIALFSPHTWIAPPCFPLSTGNHQFVLYFCEFASVLFHSLLCCIFLDATFKCYHMVFVFLVWLLSLIIIFSKSVYDAMAEFHSILCLSSVPSSLSIHLLMDT